MAHKVRPGIFTYLASRTSLQHQCVAVQFFRKHEIKALWEWLQTTGVKLYPLGILGPIKDQDYSVELDWSKNAQGEADHFQQSAAFVVTEINAIHALN